MFDLSQYDKSVADANSKDKNVIMPLISWDIYSVFFHNLKINNTDFSQLNEMASHYNWDLNLNLLEELQNNDAIIITNANLKIEFASHGIQGMTGYNSKEVLGKSPRMFQGEKTSEDKRSEIKKAIFAQKPFEATLINYRKNGETYDCHIRSFPVFNKKGVLTHFIALENAA